MTGAHKWSIFRSYLFSYDGFAIIMWSKKYAGIHVFPIASQTVVVTILTASWEIILGVYIGIHIEFSVGSMPSCSMIKFGLPLGDLFGV